MPRAMKTLDVRTRPAWRRWLQKHHASESSIWLVFHKVHTGVKSVPYDAAVEEALCFGWIDSLIARIDDDRYARKFTPRKPDSRWSDINRKRYSDMKARGALHASGEARPPTGRSYARAPTSLSPSIRKRLAASPAAWRGFNALPPSSQRACLGWVEAAKRETTREKRLRELVELLATGQKPGMK